MGKNYFTIIATLDNVLKLTGITKRGANRTMDKRLPNNEQGIA